MLSKFIRICVLALLPVLAVAEDYQAGVNYAVLAQPIKSNTGVIVVNEFFGYSCPHCNAFEPSLHHWAEQQQSDLAFVPVPVVFGRSWEPYAKAYYMARQLGILDQTHSAMYNAVHIQKRRISTRAALQNFFAEQGVNEADFDKAYNSFDLKNKLRQGNRLAARAKITGVPTMLVNGKYVVNSTMAGGNEEMLQVVDFLVAKERAAADQ
ncbi:MAG: thiol:disulfide interchange protein DsbA/DsbL [Gammaproteobacteria bacterium]|jgi:thiol:disulfide interchange protein DsbA|nr:thiol:disulfide interchange protein DsbA/DsbL [Gammaproteobacteria bacterium]MCP4881480.1 thiol:disulfide interchange protein DsbA/DsbL [Gammaproteobacteria bacterium]